MILKIELQTLIKMKKEQENVIDNNNSEIDYITVWNELGNIKII